jgi:hypothetical protein
MEERTSCQIEIVDYMRGNKDFAPIVLALNCNGGAEKSLPEALFLDPKSAGGV